MTPDEQAWMDRVDAALLALETRVPVVQRLRSFPMDVIAVAVMKQLARTYHAVPPFTSREVDQALLDVAQRNR